MENRGTTCAQERRLAVRRSVQTRLRVRIESSSIPEQRAESVNLSKHGIYFLCRTPLEIDENIEILLKMPEEVSGEPVTEWRCSGRVVRVDYSPSLDRRIGVAVAFYHCDPLRPESPRAMELPSGMTNAIGTQREVAEMAGTK
jgi:hypothetical protein